MDALLDLFDSDAKVQESSVATKSLLGDKHDRGFVEKENYQSELSSSNNGSTLDPMSKIRIISRKISRAEQVDLLVPYQYHSSIALASMNNQALASLIISQRSFSTESNSSATTGKTNMATIGIVLSVSGTKMSSKGASFIAIAIGELHTGPAVSILVFGDAYSAYAGKISNGQVIAILASTILPPKAGSGETRITLTIRDKSQLHIFGISQDYGICSGTDKRKVNGVLENVACRMHIDKRTGCFCKTHSKPNYQAYDHGNTWGNKKKMTFVESMRGDQMKVQRSNQQGVHPQHVVYPSINNRPLNNQATSSLQMRGMFPVQAATSHQEPSKEKLRSLLSMEKSTAIHHPKSIQGHASGQGHNDLQKKSLPINPYANNQPKTVEKEKVEIQQDVLGMVLSAKAKTVMGRLNMPSSTSFLATNRPQQRKISMLVTPQRDSTAVAQVVLDKQKKIAAALKNRSINKDEYPIPHINHVKCTLTSTSFESVFGGKPLDNKEKVQILETKSQFNAETEQELYVQARLKVTELETKEEMKQKIDAMKEKKKPNGNGCIETIWKCQTCHQVFSYRPMNCVKSKHLVGISRNLKKGAALTKNEERLNITRKSVEDGGLVLGTGLNWSGLKDGSDSE